jgi:hypothetical protein
MLWYSASRGGSSETVVAALLGPPDPARLRRCAEVSGDPGADAREPAYVLMSDGRLIESSFLVGVLREVGLYTGAAAGGGTASFSACFGDDSSLTRSLCHRGLLFPKDPK